MKCFDGPQWVPWWLCPGSAVPLFQSEQCHQRPIAAAFFEGHQRISDHPMWEAAKTQGKAVVTIDHRRALLLADTMLPPAKWPTTLCGCFKIINPQKLGNTWAMTQSSTFTDTRYPPLLRLSMVWPLYA